VNHREASVDGFRSASVTGAPARPTRAHRSAVRWFYALLLFVIAIAAVVGILSTMAAGQTQVAIIIGVVAMAFFSRSLC
jgi:hypothetical protein